MTTYARINETSGEPIASLEITNLSQELLARYNLDLIAAFPQAPITNQWPVDLVGAILQSARLHISMEMTDNVATTEVYKAEADLSPEEQQARLETEHWDGMGEDGRYWTRFMMPTSTADPVFAQMQAKLDEVQQFVENGASAHDLLRNLGIEDQLSQESQPQPVAEPVLAQE